MLTCTFEVGTNLDMANVDINNRVNKATAKLPPEGSSAGISVKKKSPDMLMVIASISPDGTFDELSLQLRLHQPRGCRIARTPGVGTTMIVGQRDYAMRFWVRPDNSRGLGLTAGDLAKVIGSRTWWPRPGQVGQPPARPGTQFQYTVNVKGRLTDRPKFENMIVRTLPDGSVLRMRDVSRAELPARATPAVRTQGRRAGNRAHRLSASGRQCHPDGGQGAGLMKQTGRQFPPGLQYEFPWTPPKFVVGIHEVLSPSCEAIVLVLLVVFIFLGNFRATFIPMLAVPVSLVGTFAAFAAMGFSINTLTMLRPRAGGRHRGGRRHRGGGGRGAPHRARAEPR